MCIRSISWRNCIIVSRCICRTFGACRFPRSGSRGSLGNRIRWPRHLCISGRFGPQIVACRDPKSVARELFIFTTPWPSLSFSPTIFCFLLPTWRCYCVYFSNNWCCSIICSLFLLHISGPTRPRVSSYPFLSLNTHISST